MVVTTVGQCWQKLDCHFFWKKGHGPILLLIKVRNLQSQMHMCLERNLSIILGMKIAQLRVRCIRGFHYKLCFFISIISQSEEGEITSFWVCYRLCQDNVLFLLDQLSGTVPGFLVHFVLYCWYCTRLLVQLLSIHRLHSTYPYTFPFQIDSIHLIYIQG